MSTDGHGAYDPSDVEERPRSAYMSRKEFRNLFIAVGVLAIALIPVFSMLKRRAERAGCSNNVAAIYKAMQLYSEQNNDYFPPAYVMAENGEPAIFDGHAYSWGNLIGPYMNARAKLRCPSATHEECVKIESINEGEEAEMTYGLFAPRSGQPRNMVLDPTRSILSGETSNFGARDSFNPIPFKNVKGEKVPFDAFVIGFNDSPLLPTKQSSSVTRLAFYGATNGDFKENGECRHDGGIFFLNVEGSRLFLSPPAAKITRLGDEIKDLWAPN